MANKKSAKNRKPPGLRILQWNCRGWNSSKDEFTTNIQNDLSQAPDIILLQEHFSHDIKLSGYTAITHPIPDGGPPPKTGILIKKPILSIQLDTDPWNDVHKSVTATRVQHGENTVAIFCVYIPAARSSKADNMAWIKKMINDLARPKEPTLIAGDFNAWHRAWGYTAPDRRGKSLKRTLSNRQWTLLNDPTTPTRVGQRQIEKDTSPDLAWTRNIKHVEWTVTDDTLGSDHFPIRITIMSKKITARKTLQVVNWDKFRILWASLSDDLDLTTKLQMAHKMAKRRVTVKADVPTPDNHLLNLYESRKKTLASYRKDKTMRNRYALNKATLEVRKYTRTIQNIKWQGHCNSFNDKTSIHRLWTTFKGMLGKIKAKNTAEKLLLYLGCTKDELAEQFAKTAFPQDKAKGHVLPPSHQVILPIPQMLTWTTPSPTLNSWQPSRRLRKTQHPE